MLVVIIESISYKQSFWGKKRTVSFNGLKRFTGATLKFIDHTIAANKRNRRVVSRLQPNDRGE